MRNKIIAFLASLALIVGGVFVAATPAQASVLGCPSDTVCLYQWLNFGAPAGAPNPGWKSSFHNLVYGNAGCINLTQPAAYWANGTPLWDNSASLVVNGSGAYGQQDSITFYNSLNCSAATGETGGYNASKTSSESDLRNVPIGWNGQSAYHTIASIGWLSTCPPGGC